MPKYSYKCRKCDFSFITHHGIQETCESCPKCGNVPERQVNKFFIKKETPSSNNEKAGDLTKQAIEENREILKEFQESLKNEDYDDTDNISS